MRGVRTIGRREGSKREELATDRDGSICGQDKWGAVRYKTLRYVALRYVALRYVALRYVALRYVALRGVERRKILYKKRP
jgi:hypothetical protein